MEKINKIIFIKHMNLKLQYISLKLLIELAGQDRRHNLTHYPAIPWFTSVPLRSISII